MVINIRHTGIVVEDLDKSLEFYINKLGFKIIKQMNETGSFIGQILGIKDLSVTTVKMILKNQQMIELLDFTSHKKEPKNRFINDIGPTHIALTVRSLDTLYKDFMNDGIKFISSPKVSPDSYAKVAFCRAPEGTYIELVELLKNN